MASTIGPWRSIFDAAQYRELAANCLIHVSVAPCFSGGYFEVFLKKVGILGMVPGPSPNDKELGRAREIVPPSYRGPR